MAIDYNLVKPATEEFFEKTEIKDYSKFNESDDEDIRSVERLLDVWPGTLTAAGPYYIEKGECASCNKTFTTYDFVFTALIDANHTKSLILHTFLGNKRVVQRPRHIRCSRCGTMDVDFTSYAMGNYGCQQD